MRANIGDFVGGKFTVPSLFMGGLGDFVGGWFSVPQNPVGLGMFVPGRYAVPQTPVGLGCGSGCSCKIRGLGDTTMPATSSDPISAATDALQTWWAGLTTLDQCLIAGLAGFAVVYGLKKPTHDYHGRRLTS